MTSAAARTLAPPVRPGRATPNTRARGDVVDVAAAAAIVLARLTGTDRARVSAEPATGDRHGPDASARASARTGGPEARRDGELALPRTATFAEVRGQARGLLGDRPGWIALTTTGVSGPAYRAEVVRADADHAAVVWPTELAPTRPDRRIVHVLGRARAAPGTLLRDLPVLTQTEARCHAALAQALHATVHVDVAEALRQRARVDPDATAIADGDVAVRFADLDTAAEAYARGLRGRGLGPGDVVTFALPRSVALIAAMFGALRAGVAFSLVNPGTPPARLAVMLVEAGARLLVVGDDGPPGEAGPPVVRVADLGRAGDEPLEAHPDEAAPAYVLFTSGSTGAPKGTIVSRGALGAYLAAIIPAYGLCPADRVLQAAEPGFDVLLEEVLPTVAAGGTIVLSRPSTFDSPDRFHAFVAEHRISVLNLATSLWLTMFRRDRSSEFEPPPPSVRLVIIGSERVPPAAVAAWRRSTPETVRLVNAYGTTETTITSLVCELDDGAEPIVRRVGAVPIGYPLGNTWVRVVDPYGDPTPFGVAGELVIGGASVFSGHTGEAGRPSGPSGPSSPDGYHTGDRVCVDRTGTLVHLGRLDEQIKVRGHRVEPGEVEAALETYPGVRAAVCLVDGTDEAARLLAAVAMDRPVERGRILAHLRGLLPEWMVPEGLVAVPALPTGANGKVDRAAVRDIAARASRPGSGELTPTGRIVAACVADLLGIEPPAAADNFFAIGGNSLLAIRLVARLGTEFDAVLPARRVFLTPTIAGIAAALEAELVQRRPAPLVRRAERGTFPLTPSQRAIVDFLRTADPAYPYYEMSEAYRLLGRLDQSALRRALVTLTHEHEPLRSIIDRTGTMQRILPPHWTPMVRRIDLSPLPEGERADALRRELRVARGRFDLTAEPGFRPVILRLRPMVHVLSLCFHHVFFDGWSYGIAYRRLGELYAAYRAGRSAPAAPAGPEFGDHALRLVEQAAEDVRAADLRYWQAELAEYEPVEAARGRPGDAASSAARCVLDAGTAEAVEALARDNAATPFAVLATVFAIVLAEVAQRNDILVASNDANRDQPGTEQMIGYFATTLLTRIRPRDDTPLRALVGQVQANLARNRQHLSMQWEQLVAELGHPDAVQFRFSLQDTQDEGLRLDGVEVQRIPDEPQTRGRRAIAVAASRRPNGYEIEWYGRDDTALPSPALGLTLFARALVAGIADPDQTVATLRRRMTAVSS